MSAEVLSNIISDTILKAEDDAFGATVGKDKLNLQ
jgi:hypothetical protein